MKIAVLGITGMLGSMLVRYLARQNRTDIVATVRTREGLSEIRDLAPNVHVQVLDVETTTADEVVGVLKGASYAVNAVGIIKPYIHDSTAGEVERAIRVNAVFPHTLAIAAERARCTVLQIATDCVYSGSKGGYVETEEHDPRDAYGKTKSLGEVHSPAVHHLRCSIIGPEWHRHVSLLDWFRGQPENSTVKGFRNHLWNGITTWHFARVCDGIIRDAIPLPHVHHIVPADIVDKAALLQCFRREYRRDDVTIIATDAPHAVDRTLATLDARLNEQLWAAAGYRRVPSVGEMVSEMARITEGVVP